MSQAQANDTVRVHYTGSLEDGTVFDSSLDREPLEFILGQRMIIPGFEKAVLGMNEGDTKTVFIPPEDAYGYPREDLVVAVERAQLPPHIELQVGMILQVYSDEGEVGHVTVIGFTEDTVTLDANHPLAGQKLTFEIELIEIV
jgi:peptidylprolyl isomerase